MSTAAHTAAAGAIGGGAMSNDTIRRGWFNIPKVSVEVYDFLQEKCYGDKSPLASLPGNTSQLCPPLIAGSENDKPHNISDMMLLNGLSQLNHTARGIQYVGKIDMERWNNGEFEDLSQRIATEPRDGAHQRQQQWGTDPHQAVMAERDPMVQNLLHAMDNKNSMSQILREIFMNVGASHWQHGQQKFLYMVLMILIVRILLLLVFSKNV